MDIKAIERRLGKVTVEPCQPVVAGSVGQWTVTLTVGSVGIDEGGTIKVAQRPRTLTKLALSAASSAVSRR